MRPYYEQSGVTIFHGDCREILPSLVFDVAVSDPPYGVMLGIGKDMRGGSHGLAKEAYASYTDSEEAFRDTVVPAISLAVASSKRAAIFMAGHRVQLLPPAAAIGGIFCPAAMGRHCWGFNSFLPVLFYGKDPQLNRGDTASAIQSSAMAEKNGHPCPKPVQWMRWLVLKTSLAGETIIDPFCGSGSTLVAAKHLYRPAIGIEIEERYCEIAAKRLQQEILPLEVA